VLAYLRPIIAKSRDDEAFARIVNVPGGGSATRRSLSWVRAATQWAAGARRCPGGRADPPEPAANVRAALSGWPR